MFSSIATRRAPAHNSSTAHGAQHPAGQPITGQSCQQIVVRGIDRNARASGDDFARLPGNLFALHQKGDGRAPRVERKRNHFGAFSDKDAPFRFQPVSQLRFRKAGKKLQSGR